jgi:hypothetical protein
MPLLRRRFFWALVICGLLAGGCLSSEMNRWKGQPVEALIEAWGPPARETALGDGNKVVVYTTPQEVGVGGVGPATTCQKIFTVNAEGIIQSWSLQGC